MADNQNVASFESFLGTLEKSISADHGDKASGAVVALARGFGKEVDSFLDKCGGARMFKPARGATVATENFHAQAFGAIGADEFVKLAKAAKVPERHLREACLQLHRVLSKATAGSNAGIWSEQTKKGSMTSSSDGTTVIVGTENLYARDMISSMSDVMPGQESFGVSTDNAAVDVKAAIIVSLLKWHTTLIPRIFAVRTTATPEVAIIRETNEVYTLDDTAGDSTTSMVDLLTDPSLVNTNLQKIVPLTANDGVTNVLRSNGVVKFNVVAPLLALSIDPAKYGFSKVNRTDIVADSVRLEVVYVTIGDGTDVETIAITIPEQRGRLTRNPNADTAQRTGDINYRAYITRTTKNTAGANSVILAKSGAADDVFIVDMTVKPSINLRDGSANALGFMKITAGNKEGAAPNAGTVTLAGTVGGHATTTLYGYSLDAKFSEENLRKTNFAVQNRKTELRYQIATGRNFVMDYAFNDERSNSADNAATLSNLIRIGMDDRAIGVIETTLDSVRTENNIWIAGGKKKNDEPGRYFALGGKVIPTALSDTLDFTGITAIRDADRSGDIKQRVISFFTALTSKILADSKFTQQLTPGTPACFRLITGIQVLGNALGQPHIHNHLDKSEVKSSADGVELRIVLPSGVILEVVTAPFSKLYTKILVVPFVDSKEAPEMNFAINYDYGTVVAHYAFNGQGGSANQRLYANSREWPVQTNAIGAIVDVVGLDEATFLLATP